LADNPFWIPGGISPFTVESEIQSVERKRVEPTDILIEPSVNVPMNEKSNPTMVALTAPVAGVFARTTFDKNNPSVVYALVKDLLTMSVVNAIDWRLAYSTSGALQMRAESDCQSNDSQREST